MRRTTKGVVAVTAAAGLTLLAAGPASASPSCRHGETVRVTGSTGPTQFSSTHLHAGVVQFDISTTNPNGTGVALFSLHRGVTLDQVSADIAEEFSADPAVDAKGTRDLVRDVTVYGLADVEPGSPARATVVLKSGTYYSFDPETGQAPTYTKLTVRGRDDRQDGLGDRGLARVDLTTSDRFVVHGHLAARGSVLVRNVSDTLHFMTLQPVKPGTTDAEVQAYFDSGAQSEPAFALDGPTASTDVLSPGRNLVLSYHLPKGTYVLLCFVADDETGMPHALMGMHKVIKIG